MARSAPPTIRSGARWHHGAGDPASNIGLDGDYYINTTNGAIWSKDGGAWSNTTLIIKGQDGAAPHTDTLLSSADANLTAGYTASAPDDGTQSTGTYTPSPVAGNLRYYTNGGAHTFAAPTAAGDYHLTVQITNNASAGSITLSGFSKTSGDDFTTTDGHDFIAYITKINGFTSITVEALQ